VEIEFSHKLSGLQSDAPNAHFFLSCHREAPQSFVLIDEIAIQAQLKSPVHGESPWL